MTQIPKTLIYDGRTCLVLSKNESFGPEPHYNCLFKNENIILAVQPSGRVVEMFSNGYFLVYSYWENGNNYQHREIGPSYYKAISSIQGECYNEYHIDGIRIPSYEYRERYMEL